MANEVVGDFGYVNIVAESTWGTLADTPTYLFVPVNEYSVRHKSESRQANTFTGLMQRKHNNKFRGMPEGNMNLPLYGYQTTGSGSSTSVMQYFLDWAYNEWEVAATASKSIEWAEGPNIANKRHLGMRVDTATLSGQDGGAWSLNLGLKGKSEVGQATMTTGQTLPTDMEKMVHAEFSESTFTLAGSAILLESFSLTAEYGLQVKYLNSATPSLLLKTKRDIKVSITPVLNADTYEIYNRLAGMTEVTGGAVIKGLHNGTGATGDYTLATFAFPRLSFDSSQITGGRNEIRMTPLEFIALKPDSSGKDMTIAYSEA